MIRRVLIVRVESADEGYLPDANSVIDALRQSGFECEASVEQVEDGKRVLTKHLPIVEAA